MRVFLAGATGAIGQHLVPQLQAAGHDVIGTTRSAARARELEAAGVQPVVLDGLDREAVLTAVMRTEPGAILHELTGLGDASSGRSLDRTFAVTNALRTQGTDNLLEAARMAGVARVVAQSFAGWPSEPTGGPVKTEDDPLDPDPPSTMRETLAAIRHVETRVPAADGMEGLVLRYGGFYGPGSAMEHEYLGLIRRRRLPMIGDGGGVWSWVHLADAAAATVLALERGAPGVYNIVDDDPAPVREWLPALAEALGAPRPRRIPAWAGRVLAGEAAVSMMTRIRGASNAKARRELGWAPAHSSWRTGFKEVFGGRPGAGRPRPREAV